ncbi:MAG: lytic transglycosylase domain-containing protein [Clostridium sp.]|nr:lytic transglycosylase domain-containing protein [Clostridium sp.]
MKKGIGIFLLIIIVILLALNVKNIARHFYPIKYSNYVYEYSSKYKLDPYFVAAVIKTESNFNCYAKSNKDAYGLMQITSTTGNWSAGKMGYESFDASKLYDPEFNISMGCWYLSDLRDEFKNLDLVAAAYNGGRGNVRQWLKSSKHSSDGKNLHYIPFPETDKYVKKIKVYYNLYKWLYNGQ